SILYITRRHHCSTLFPYTTLFRSFRDLWNDAANGHNEYIAGYAPGGKQSVYTTPPGWGYAVPYFSPTSGGLQYYGAFQGGIPYGDRKSTRLNSSHVKISYAVFCLK